MCQPKSREARHPLRPRRLPLRASVRRGCRTRRPRRAGCASSTRLQPAAPRGGTAIRPPAPGRPGLPSPGRPRKRRASARADPGVGRPAREAGRLAFRLAQVEAHGGAQVLEHGTGTDHGVGVHLQRHVVALQNAQLAVGQLFQRADAAEFPAHGDRRQVAAVAPAEVREGGPVGPFRRRCSKGRSSGRPASSVKSPSRYQPVSTRVAPCSRPGSMGGASASRSRRRLTSRRPEAGHDGDARHVGGPPVEPVLGRGDLHERGLADVAGVLPGHSASQQQSEHGPQGQPEGGEGGALGIIAHGAWLWSLSPEVEASISQSPVRHGSPQLSTGERLRRRIPGRVGLGPVAPGGVAVLRVAGALVSLGLDVGRRLRLPGVVTVDALDAGHGLRVIVVDDPGAGVGAVAASRRSAPPWPDR